MFGARAQEDDAGLRWLFLALPGSRAAAIAGEIVDKCWKRLDEPLDDRGRGRLGPALADALPELPESERGELLNAIVETASLLAGARWWRGPREPELLRVQPGDLRGALLLHLSESRQGAAAQAFLRNNQEWRRLLRDRPADMGTEAAAGAARQDADLLLRIEYHEALLITRVGQLESQHWPDAGARLPANARSSRSPLWLAQLGRSPGR